MRKMNADEARAEFGHHFRHHFNLGRGQEALGSIPKLFHKFEGNSTNYSDIADTKQSADLRIPNKIYVPDDIMKVGQSVFAFLYEPDTRCLTLEFADQTKFSEGQEKFRIDYEAIISALASDRASLQRSTICEVDYPIENTRNKAIISPRYAVNAHQKEFDNIEHRERDRSVIYDREYYETILARVFWHSSVEPLDPDAPNGGAKYHGARQVGCGSRLSGIIFLDKNSVTKFTQNLKKRIDDFQLSLKKDLDALGLDI